VVSRTTLSRGLAILFVVSASCKEKREPVEVPFEGLAPKPNRAPDAPTSTTPTATATASADVSAAAPRAMHPGMEACCQALRMKSAFSREEGSKANYATAADVCDLQRKLLREGKVTVSQAWSTIRSSLLGDAPPQCR
jgi:hypothetical protein